MPLPTPAPLSHGQMRAQNLRNRLEAQRMQATTSKESTARPDRSAASSREFLTKSLGKKEGPTQGTSIARMNIHRGSSMPPSNGMGGGIAMPPVLPPRKF